MSVQQPVTSLRVEPITSLADFTAQIEAALARGIPQPWYRGVGRSSYKLSPSLFRHPDPTISGDVREIFDTERKIIAHFRQRGLPFLTRHSIS